MYGSEFRLTTGHPEEYDRAKEGYARLFRRIEFSMENRVSGQATPFEKGSRVMIRNSCADIDSIDN